MDPRDDRQRLRRWLDLQDDDTDDDEGETVVMGDRDVVKGLLEQMLSGSDDDDDDDEGETVVFTGSKAAALSFHGLPDELEGEASETIIMSGGAARDLWADEYALEDEDTDTRPMEDEAAVWGDRLDSQPTFAPGTQGTQGTAAEPYADWGTPAPAQTASTPHPALPDEDEGHALGIAMLLVALMLLVLSVLLAAVAVVLAL